MISKQSVLELKTRNEIYSMILKYPGLHLREIVRNLNISEGAIRYHIKYLEKRDLIIKKMDRGYARFYITNKSSEEDKKLLSFFRRETPRNIILNLLVNIHASQNRISKDLEITPKAISYHLKNLLDKDIIEVVKVDNGIFLTKFKKSKLMECKTKGREVLYQLKDPYMIFDFLIANKNKLFDCGITESMIYLFNNLTPEKPPKKLKENITTTDRFLEVLYEIFPNPYYV